MLLRKVRRSRWITVEQLDWLETDQIPADPLGDLQTSDNELSVWFIGNDASNLDQVLTAIASNSSFISNVDYALIDEGALSELRLEVRETPGGTPLKSANAWHRDLIHLSGSKILALAEAILSKGEIKRVMERRTTKLLVNAVTTGQIELENLEVDLQERLRPHLPNSR